MSWPEAYARTVGSQETHPLQYLRALVIPSYTYSMKTAISVPEETFERATRRAQELGMSRSEFFSRAAENYLDELDSSSVTKQINEALELAGAADESNVAAVAAGHALLHSIDDEW